MRWSEFPHEVTRITCAGLPAISVRGTAAMRVRETVRGAIPTPSIPAPRRRALSRSHDVDSSHPMPPRPFRAAALAVCALSAVAAASCAAQEDTGAPVARALGARLKIWQRPIFAYSTDPVDPVEAAGRRRRRWAGAARGRPAFASGRGGWSRTPWPDLRRRVPPVGRSAGERRSRGCRPRPRACQCRRTSPVDRDSRHVEHAIILRAQQGF